MKKSYDIATGIATFTFDDGLPTLTLDSAKMSPENEQAMLGHGILARVGDMAALPRKNPKTGQVIVITEAMRHAEIKAGITHYESGTTDWNLKGGDRTPKQNPTILALAVARKITYAEAEAFIANLTLADAPE